MTELSYEAILSAKIDSQQKMQDAREELGDYRFTIHFGTNPPITDMNWFTIRDSLRFGTNYWLRPDGFMTISSRCDVSDCSFLDTLHVSKADGVALVAFAENEEKRKRDVFTRMKYGRYLTKYFGTLDNEEVKRLVSRFDYSHGDVEVHFGETEEEFIRAINDGPSESCMADLSYDGHIHPAAIYAYGDIKVAWLEDGDGRITARAVICKETGEFSRVYGDEGKLKPALEAQGYTSQTHALVGCRLRKIENKNGSGYIMAYVDAGVASGGGSLRVNDRGDYWELVTSGETDTYVGYDNNGVTTRGYDYTCDNCGDGVNEDDSHYSEYHGETLCTHCADNHYSYAVVGRYDGRDLVRNNRVTFVDATNTLVATEYLDDYMDRRGLIYASYSGDIIDCEEAVYTVDQEWEHMDDCSIVGENSDGETMYVLSHYIKRYLRHYYWSETDRGVYHVDSVEVQNWLDELNDPEVVDEEDGFDSMEYTRLDMVNRVVSEVMCYPTDFKFPTEIVCYPQVSEPVAYKEVVSRTTIEVGDVVRVVQITLPLSAAGRDSELMGAEGTVTQISPTGDNHIVEFFVGGSSMRLYVAPEDVVLVWPEVRAPRGVDWRAAYRNMQAAGVKFEFFDQLSAWHKQWCGFDKPQSHYRLDPDQLPPENWQEVYKKAQSAGIEFCFVRGVPIPCVFDDRFSDYQLAAAVQLQQQLAA